MEKLSRSEQKRRAKNIEKLTTELADLSPGDINRLPCEKWLQDEIADIATLKAGARKRQLKYVTKNLRAMDPEPLFDFLSEQKGSRLKQNREFQELEKTRDRIIDDVLAAATEANAAGEQVLEDYQSPALDAAINLFPDLKANEVRTSALRFVRTRKITHSREIFRSLKTAADQAKRR